MMFVSIGYSLGLYEQSELIRIFRRWGYVSLLPPDRFLLLKILVEISLSINARSRPCETVWDPDAIHGYWSCI